MVRKTIDRSSSRVKDLELALSQASTPGSSVTPGQTIGEVGQVNVAATTLRYYEKLGLIAARFGGQRRYDDSVLARLEVIRLCKTAGFALDEIQMLFADDLPGRPASRALAEAKLGEIDARMAELARAREIIE